MQINTINNNNSKQQSFGAKIPDMTQLEEVVTKHLGYFGDDFLTALEKSAKEIKNIKFNGEHPDLFFKEIMGEESGKNLAINASIPGCSKAIGKANWRFGYSLDKTIASNETRGEVLLESFINTLKYAVENIKESPQYMKGRLEQIGEKINKE